MLRGAVLATHSLTPRLYLVFLFLLLLRKELVLGLENLQVGYILKPPNRHTQSDSGLCFLVLCPLLLPRTPPSPHAVLLCN